MKKLTTAEEQIMQILWKINQGFVKEILNEFPEPKPAYNTVSTILRILVDKGFVYYQAFSKSHQYYPLVTQSDYVKSTLNGLVKDYFSNSYKNLVSFFTREDKLDPHELEEILKSMDKTDAI